MIIVGVDPGKVTGIAMFVRAADGTNMIHAEEVPAAQVGTSLRQWTAGIHDVNMIWALEQYTQSSGRGRPKTAQPDALIVTGVVQDLRGNSRLVRQQPAAAKRICPDGLLKTIGWWQPTPDGHANDAKRHIVLAMSRYYPKEFAELIGV